MSAISTVTGWFKGAESKRPLPPPGPPPEEPGTVRDWTVLVYGNGNVPDVDYEIWSSVQSLGSIGTNSKVALVAQVARHSQGGQAQRLSFEAPRTDDDHNVKVEKDLFGLAQQLANAPEIGDPALKQAAHIVASGVYGPVVRAGSVGDTALRGAKGMSIWAPTRGTDAKLLDEYRQTPFAQATGWDRVVRKYG